MQNQASKKVQRIILDLNKSGMEYLSHNQFKQALELLKKAEKLVAEEIRVNDGNVQMSKLQGITLNNMGCYYKKTNKPKVALSYLKRALQVQVYAVEDWIATASTHLNICAIFSFTGKHQQASDHAGLSVKLLQRESTSMPSPTPQLLNLLMISYYNLGVEFQHLKNYSLSCEAYRKGAETARKAKRGEDMLKILEESVERTWRLAVVVEKRVVEINEKKREMEEKGGYEGMRRNKKRRIAEEGKGRYEEYTREVTGSQHSQVKLIQKSERMRIGHSSDTRIVRKKKLNMSIANKADTDISDHDQ